MQLRLSDFFKINIDLKFYLPVFFWALFIFILSMMPGKYVAPVNIWDLASFDKIGHVFVFFVLMGLALRGITKQINFKTLPFRFFLFAFIVCTVYGFLLEVMQGTLATDRQFDMYDTLANMLGCLLGGVLFKYPVQAIMMK